MTVAKSQRGAIKQLQAQVARLSSLFTGGSFGEFGPAAATSTPNSVSSILLAKPDGTAPTANGITVKREDATWGASGTAYGSGQAFEVLSPSTQAASDKTGDGVPGSNENPVLFRVDPWGGLGTTQGIHIAPGLRNSHGGLTPTQGMWIQQTCLDAVGLILSGPDPSVIATPTASFLLVETYAGKVLAGIDSLGQIKTYADNGTTPALGLYPGNAGVAGYRAIFTTQAASTGGVAVKTAASQSAYAFAVIDSGAKVRSAFVSGGDLITFADDGVTNAGGVYAGSTPFAGYRGIFNPVTAASGGVAVRAATSQTGMLYAAVDTGSHVRAGIDALFSIITYNDTGTTAGGAIYSGTTPSFGYRSILATLSASTGGLAIKLASGQTAPALVVVDGGGTSHTIVNSSGGLVGASSGVTSVNGDTGPAVTLSATDVGAAPADSSHPTFLAIAGVAAPSNTTTPAGWFSIYIPSNGQTAKVPIYQ